MKSSILLFLIVSCVELEGQVKWDGGAFDGLWSSAENWFGDAVPLPGDAVLLDNSMVSGSYTVTLPGGAVTTTLSSLIVSPGSASGITLVLPSSNTAEPGLLINGTGDAFILMSGAVFRNSTGAAGGTGLTVVNSFRINNGGRYIHNTPRGHAGIVSQLSTAAGTETGIFEFDIPSSSASLSLSGRNYGTLRLLSVANGGQVNYLGGGSSPLTIRGNLEIGNGVNFNISLSAATTIHGNLQQGTSGNFNLQSSSHNNMIYLKGNMIISGNLTETGTGTPMLELNGNNMQHITVTGQITNQVGIVVNNSGGMNLNSSLVIPYQLHLLSGKVISGNTNLLIFSPNSSCIGGSVSSFINGPVQKNGSENFTFQVGEGNIYAPVSLSNGSGAQVTDRFVVQYRRESPMLISQPVFEPPLHHVSFVEYWRIERLQGAASKQVTLEVGANSFALTPSELRVSRWDGASWKNHGQVTFIPGIPALPYMTGQLTSEMVNDFQTGIFSIASTGNGTINPLPVQFVYTTILKQGRNYLLQWKMAERVEGRFYVEHSENGLIFSILDSVRAGNSLQYEYPFNNNINQAQFYRLRLFRGDSGLAVSPVARWIPDQRRAGLWPNPTSGDFTAGFYSKTRGYCNLFITNTNGQMVDRQVLPVVPGINQVSVSASGLPPGIYLIQIKLPDGEQISMLMSKI